MTKNMKSASLLLFILVSLSGCAGEQQPIASEPTLMWATGNGAAQTIRIHVNHGYAPNNIIARPNKPIILDFVRDEEVGSCARDLEFPTLKITKTLPNHVTTQIKIPPQPVGQIPFRCSMDMMRGVIEVR